jgi:hypothetical protein|tara:strand:- start:36 stop:488 length:453 start_codon:yes stop_codon:yes gene_type:complete
MAMTPPDMGMMSRPQVANTMEAKPPAPMVVNAEQFQNAVNNLSPDAMETLDQHLTPRVKEAIGELFGDQVKTVLKDIGPDEPTINIPISVVADAYPAQTIEESIQMMGQDFASKGQQNIPTSPQGGLGGEPMMDSPQTNVPPGPMPTDMV